MKIIITGGTLSKEYCPLQGAMVFTNASAIEDLFEGVFLNDSVDVIEWNKLVDSRAMTDFDRECFYRFCFTMSYPNDEPLIIIHGTDTMEYTARYFAEQSEWGGKLAVFTGSWLPLAYKDTDAEFDLGFAYACAKIKPPGIYVAMNGVCFDGDNVTKNWGKMRFEPLVSGKNEE